MNVSAPKWDGHTLRCLAVGAPGPCCWVTLTLTCCRTRPACGPAESWRRPLPQLSWSVAQKPSPPLTVMSCDSGWGLFWVWSC